MFFFFFKKRGPIAWIYPAEIFPQMIRANAMGVSTSFSYLFNLFISLVSPVMFREIMWGTYLFFGCMCVIMASVVYTFYPETRVSFLLLFLPQPDGLIFFSIIGPIT
jgi:hypothetical protein